VEIIVVISIRDPDSCRMRDVLHLGFDDADPPTTDSTSLPPAQAQRVLKFVARYERFIGKVVVHCGQAAIRKSMGRVDREFWRDYSSYRFVFHIARKVV
jgi:predicted protein tyrosine phosphatase